MTRLARAAAWGVTNALLTITQLELGLLNGTVHHYHVA
ncbi:hypothetical protein EDC56_2833 [Sinobacterium caligoides]|uniref:Uncharacterized protein n=1 Tax=Sinobacterium caligoides TaxID=933926 RepID=A0A3N2DLG8_9GAMM|nr:hypothetical protein EDC56_2833 [Sinobacterium caligoides]